MYNHIYVIDIYQVSQKNLPSILKQEVFVNDGVVGSKGKSWKIGIIGEKEKLSMEIEIITLPKKKQAQNLCIVASVDQF